MRGAGAAIVAWLLVGCSSSRPAEARPGVDAALSTAAWSLIQALPPPTDDALPSEPIDAPEPVVASEATRVRSVRADWPELVAFRERVDAHFGAGHDLALQQAELPGGASALLVTSATDESHALILVVDAGGALLWFKDRPLAGVVPGSRHLTLAIGQGGRVHLLFHAASYVAARTWLSDGSILSDHVLLESPTSDALAGVHMPGVGLVAVASLPSGLRAQLLTDEGGVKWGEAGATVGTLAGGVGRVALAADEDGWLLVRHTKDASGVHDLVAFRYDARAIPVWTAPVDLGPVAPPEPRSIRFAPASGDRTLVGPFRTRSGQPRRILLSRSGDVTRG